MLKFQLLELLLERNPLLVLLRAHQTSPFVPLMSAPADEDQRALPNGMIATAELEDLAGPLSKALAHIIKALTQLDSATAAESNVYTGTAGVAGWLFLLKVNRRCYP